MFDNFTKALPKATEGHLFPWPLWLIRYYNLTKFRKVFRIQSIICDGAFQQKQLKPFSSSLFSQKSSIVGVRLGFKKTSVV